MSATVTEESPARADESASPDRIGETVESVGADKVLGEIRKNCFILYVTVRAWRGQYLLRNAEVKVDGRTVDPEMMTGSHWKLIPKKWHKAIQPFESRTRNAVYRVGVAFKDGVYVVPKTAARALVDEIKAIRRDYAAKVAEFQAEWPTIVEDLRQKLVAELGGDRWLEVAKLIPDARRLAKMYDIEIGLWPLGGGGGLPVECVEDLERAAGKLEAMNRLADRVGEVMQGDDANLLDEFIGYVRRMWETASRSAGRLIEENAEEYMEEARQVTNRMVAQAVESMIAEPIREFVETVDNLAEVASKQTARGASIEAVRRAFQKLRGFQFLMPEEVVDRLRRVEVQVRTVDARDLNSGSLAGGLIARELRAIRDELSTETAHAAAFGRFSRNLDL